MTDYRIKFFDPDYQIPDVDLTKFGLEDTWKIERVPAITLPVQIVASVSAQVCWENYVKQENGEGEWVITNR